MKTIGKCTFIMIGTLVGAGFASGQEIASFFNRFGVYGAWGALLASVLFGVIIFLILQITAKQKLHTYEELISHSRFFKWTNQIFLFVCFCIMIAGISAFFQQQLKLPYWIGALIGSSICYLIFSYRYRGLEVFNMILVPFIILGILMIGLGKYDLDALQEIKYTMPKTFTNHWLLSSILYVGYNSLMLIPMITTFSNSVAKKSQRYAISILSFIAFAVLGLLIFHAIGIFFPKILVFELPTLKLAEMLGPVAKVFYSMIILFAIFTTAISCGYSFLEMGKEKILLKPLAKQRKQEIWQQLFLCITAVFLSRVGFSKLLNILFPIFGYFGIIQIFYILSVTRRKKGVTNDKG